MFRKLTILLIAVNFLFIGIATFAISAEKPAITTTQPSTTQPSTTQPPTAVKPGIITQPVFFCPSGWQRKPNTTDFACVPNPPTGKYCATLAGEYYLPLSSCQFLHGKCMGCLVACEKGNFIHAPMPCPSGWHMKPYPACQGCSVCVPNSPTPINCPAGYNYYEMLECKPGIGTQCVGCEVGCAKPQAPPR